MSKQILESNRHQFSFTLIELAIVMVIMGILANKTESDKIRETNETLDKIEQAIYNYIAEYGSLPCPADGTLAETNASFGVPTQVNGNAGCYGTPPSPQPPPYWSATMPNFDMGNVPNKELKIPDELAYDAWGRRINYAIIENCSTSSLQYLPGYSSQIANPNYYAAYNFSNSCGGSYSVNKTGMVVKDASGTIITQNAVLVLISYGKNGHGAYPHNGGSTQYCAGGTISADEITNAQMNSSCSYVQNLGYFVQKNPIYSPPVYAPGATTAGSSTYFDDIVRYKTRDQLIQGARMIKSGNSVSLGYLCNMVNSVVNSLSASQVICGTNLTPNTGNGSCASSYLWVLASQIQKFCI